MKQKEERVVLAPLGNINLGMKLNFGQFKRFEKQIILKKIGFKGQKKIFAGNVLIIGLGGLGCPLLTYLAASGVGKIDQS